MSETLADATIFVEPDMDMFSHELVQETEQAGDTAGRQAGRRFGESMKVAMAAVAVAVGAALVTGLNGAIEQGNSNALLAAQLGATPEQARRLGEISGNLYAQNFGENIQEIDAALKGVFQNGLAGAETAAADVEKVGAKVLNLSKVLGEDTDKTSAAIAQMLRTGIAKTSDEAFDIMFKAAQSGVNKAGDLLDTVTEYGTEFRQLGLTGQQAMGLLSQGLKAGARDADTVADALKEFAIRGQDLSKTSLDAYAALGINAQKASQDVAKGGAPAAAVLDTVLAKLRAMPEGAERTALAVALFGTKAEDLQKSLFALDLSKASGEMQGFEGAADRAGKTLGESAGAQVESFKRQVEQGLINAVAKAIPFLQSMAGFVARNADVIKPAAAVIGGLAAAIWLVNTATAVWAATQTAANAIHLTAAARWIAHTAATVAHAVATGVVRVATLLATAAQWLYTQALAASGIGALLILVGLLIGVIIYLATKTTFFQDLWKAVWPAVRDFFVNAWDAIVGAAKAVGRFFTDTLPSFFSNAWNRVKAIFTAFFSFYLGLFERIVSFAASIPGRIIGFFVNLGSRFYSIGQDIVHGVINGISSLIGRLADMAVQMAKRALNAAKNFLGISSPSKVFAVEVGRNSALGIIQGMAASEDAVAGAGSSLADAALPAGPAAAGGGGLFAELARALAALTVQVIVDGRVIEDATLRVLKKRPEDAALAVRAGEKRLAHA